MKGEAQERWGLKEASKVLRCTNHREGSQTLSVALLKSRVTLFRHLPIKGRARKGT